MRLLALNTSFIILLIIALAVYSCNGFQGADEGQIILSSQFDFEMATLTGYHFESASFVSFPSVEGEIPDIVVDQFRLLDGSIKPGFSSPDNMNGFALVASYEEKAASDDFFRNELKEVDSSLAYAASSDTVRLFQVWVLKTSLGNFAKLHVLAIDEIDTEFGKYNNVTIDFVYQPDGSPVFP
jgi:hypothetical protein